MTKFVLAAVLCLVAVAGASANAKGISSRVSAPAAPCRSGDDKAVALKAELTRVMAASDSSAIYMRDSVYRVPVVHADSIHIVTDSATCQQVLGGLAAITRPGFAPATEVYVADLGGVAFAAMDPDSPNAVAILSRQFTVIGGFAGD